MSLKQSAIQVISALPEDASYETVSEELAILAALQDAETDIQQGCILNHDEVKDRLKAWISS